MNEIVVLLLGVGLGIIIGWYFGMDATVRFAKKLIGSKESE